MDKSSKSVRKEITIREKLFAQIQKAANERGVSFSEYVRLSCIAEIQRDAELSLRGRV